MKIQLSDHFTYKSLLRFTVPPIMMMLFTSIYGVVDGLFVSNVVGETAFASINLVLPYCMLFGSVGSLFGVGGSALIALVKGQGDDERADRIFTLLIYAMLVSGVFFMLLAQLLLPAAVRFLGASAEMERISVRYGRIFLLGLPAFLLQYGFQSFLITAERPKLGLLFTVAAGVSNMILDWLFIAVFHWGVAGAAAATCTGQLIGGVGPLLFFLFSRSSSLKLVRTRFMGGVLLKSASNGMADFITNVAISLVNMVFNWQLMKYLGELGVSAYGIIMYMSFVFVAVFLGYSMGVAPVISYHFGAGDYPELRNLFGKSVCLILISSLTLTCVALLSARQIASVFAGYDAAFLALSTRALRLYSLRYFFSGLNTFGSSLFAALNDGRIAGLLSGLRMFVFQLLAVMLLPLIFGGNGIWLSMLFSDVCVFLLTSFVVLKKRGKYHYF